MILSSSSFLFSFFYRIKIKSESNKKINNKVKMSIITVLAGIPELQKQKP